MGYLHQHLAWVAAAFIVSFFKLSVEWLWKLSIFNKDGAGWTVINTHYTTIWTHAFKYNHWQQDISRCTHCKSTCQMVLFIASSLTANDCWSHLPETLSKYNEDLSMLIINLSSSSSSSLLLLMYWKQRCFSLPIYRQFLRHTIFTACSIK